MTPPAPAPSAIPGVDLPPVAHLSRAAPLTSPPAFRTLAAVRDAGVPAVSCGGLR